jgi:GTPase SAR1 family protein
LQFSGSAKTLRSLGIHRAMLQKKVCMLGAHGVGKRSLTAGCEAPFGGELSASVGVRICKKALEINGRGVTLMIWDIADWDRWGAASTLLRGMEGYLIVADGTRPETLERARAIFEQIWSYEEPQPTREKSVMTEGSGFREQFPYRKVPFLLLLNKCDLTKEWKIEKSFLQIFANKAWPVKVVSAKENQGVEEAFLNLGRGILNQIGVKPQD